MRPKGRSLWQQFNFKPWSISHAALCGLGARAGGPIKALAGFQHRVHDDSEFACHGDRRPLEADLFPQLQSPGSKRAVSPASSEDHRRSLIQEAPQMIVATPRYMPLEVNLSRLVAPCGEAQPRAH